MASTCGFRYQGTSTSVVCGEPVVRQGRCKDHCDRDATLRCSRCGVLSYCYVQADTKVGDVLNTGECDRCSFDSDTGRTAVVIEVA